MISKTLPADSIYHTCRYICNRKEAEVLHSEGVRGHDYKLMAKDFEMQQQMRPSKKVGCFHAILSFHPDEKPSDAMLTEIAQKYLERLKVVNTQYSIVKHTDKAHLHLHVIANMINNDGRSISDSYIGLRGKKTAQQLTKEYNLIPATRKNLALTHLENMSETEVNRYKIYMAISEALPYCRSMKELEKALLKQEIETMYKYKGQTTEIQGVSFKTGEFSYKGSKVDRKFSYGNLQKIFDLYHKLAIKQAKESETLEKQGGNVGGKTLPSQTNATSKEVHAQQQTTGDLTTEAQARGMQKAIEILLSKEELPYDDIGKEFLPKYRRKKKRSRGKSR